MIGSMSLLLGTVLLQVAPSLPTAQVPAAMCEIGGRVTDKETGQPIARAIVGISMDGGKTRLATRTDDEGVYRFTNLAPGQYMGHVEPGEFRATHISTSIGPARILLLKAGDVRRDINVALQRGRAITVRVVDDAGEAAAGMHVSLRTIDGGREFNPSRLRVTDDRGRLRLFGLQPGRYIACVDPRSGSFSAAGSQLRRERLLRTCYPSAATSADAEPIRVDQSDIEDLEIRMRRGRTFTISGTVQDSSGAVASDAMVSLNRFERSSSSGTGVDVKKRPIQRSPTLRPATTPSKRQSAERNGQSSGGSAKKPSCPCASTPRM